ncbi:hypothetical protein GLOTRDRAFT_124597 [Gloeophyllum trabeum ATCC 11539]|uniref:Uncharacterized protein n=1 Tax=Gloeophyllum trabeum (strain ATCC 11539 / FP-39264 / Madison 617) TaxID=670483 RepID=S7QMY3_GLOTA|nr:uncharacterized protein GLOTRDRAFT_124597 [Gloeophyllum trabeum ATCC 11539]EPQ60853.1 hypothetical protein GLOTRDRAFT_124597 [Gloeophyllum trabeum ATCC 11539]
MASTSPPYYVLVSRSTLRTDDHAPAGSILSHPVIQYQYVDDSPLSLLPESEDEHVLVLDWDPAAAPPTGRSLSKGLSVTGVKITDAPGAGIADEEDRKNDKMYILDAVMAPEARSQDDSQEEEKDAMVALSRFKDMNAVLRRALDYPDFSALRTPQPQVAVLKQT